MFLDLWCEQLLWQNFDKIGVHITGMAFQKGVDQYYFARIDGSSFADDRAAMTAMGKF